MLALETRELSKRFGPIRSLESCSILLEQGRVLGLLGPNGAGKSTLIRLILGYLLPTSGSGFVLGLDIVAETVGVRRNISYLPAEPRFPRALKGRDVLQLYSELHGCGDTRRAILLAERLSLDLSRRVMFMSTGMKQKLGLALVLSKDCPVFILDEPTANIDPDIRREVLQIVLELKSAGKTTIVSSHQFDDVETVCTDVALLRSGRLVKQMPISELQPLYIVQCKSHNENLNTDALIHPALRRIANPTGAVVSTDDDALVRLEMTGQPELWIRWLADQKLKVISIQRSDIHEFYNDLPPQPNNKAEH